MLAEERLSRIMKLLSQQRTATVQELCEALDLHGHSPEYSGYSFLPDGRYASGVWLANPEEVWSYVMMQKDYQYRILICDRDDFAVLEMLEGRMIFPDVQSLEQFQQAQKDGGMEMI